MLDAHHFHGPLLLQLLVQYVKYLSVPSKKKKTTIANQTGDLLGVCFINILPFVATVFTGKFLLQLHHQDQLF